MNTENRTDQALVVERKSQTDGTNTYGPVSVTPQLGETYWSYRVLLSERQAIVGFPKFFTIGIGFAIEDADWNTNLPYTCDAAEIADHISENKGDASIPDKSVIEAIRLIQAAIAEDVAASA